VSRVARNFILALVLVVVAVVVGSRIGHRRTSTPTTTTSPVVTSTTVATSTTVTTSTVPTSTTTVTASLTTCRGSQFTGTNVGSEGAAGTGYDIMTLTKTSPGSCVVDGYPIVSFLGAKGVVVTGLSVRDATDFPIGAAQGPPRAHTIVTGQKVGLQVRYADIPVGTATCPSVSQINVQFVAGDQSVPVKIAYPIAPCGGALAVSAFYRG
jgi:hypothetical protein